MEVRVALQRYLVDQIAIFLLQEGTNTDHDALELLLLFFLLTEELFLDLHPRLLVDWLALIGGAVARVSCLRFSTSYLSISQVVLVGSTSTFGILSLRSTLFLFILHELADVLAIGLGVVDRLLIIISFFSIFLIRKVRLHI